MKVFTRRNFLKAAGTVAAGAVVYHFRDLRRLFAQDAAADGKKIDTKHEGAGGAKVYFTERIDAESLVKLYDLVSGSIIGKVAMKLHTGERHGPNILPRSMVKALQQSIPNSNIVETNTLYSGDRDTTAKHRDTLKINGWDFCPVDIMDEDGAVMLPVYGRKHFKEMSVGKNLVDYDAMVVLTHFKGHTMGGFGGSMKNIAIGCADASIGKRMQHGSGFSITGAQFQERMAESAKAVMDYFGGHIVYINVMRRMSVDCDCAGTSAAAPAISDIGMLASADLLAIDQASVDLVYKRPEREKRDLVERIESRQGLRQLSYMRELGMGAARYELVSID